MSENCNRIVHVSSRRRSPPPKSRQLNELVGLSRTTVNGGSHRNRENETNGRTTQKQLHSSPNRAVAVRSAHDDHGNLDRSRTSDSSPRFAPKQRPLLNKHEEEKLRDDDHPAKPSTTVVKLRRPLIDTNCARSSSAVSITIKAEQQLPSKRPRQKSPLRYSEKSPPVDGKKSVAVNRIRPPQESQPSSKSGQLSKAVPKTKFEIAKPSLDDAEEGEITDEKVTTHQLVSNSAKGYSKWSSPPPLRNHRSRSREDLSHNSSVSNVSKKSADSPRREITGKKKRSSDERRRDTGKASPKQQLPLSGNDKKSSQRHRSKVYVSSDHAREVVELESSSEEDERDNGKSSIKRHRSDSPPKKLHAEAEAERHSHTKLDRPNTNERMQIDADGSSSAREEPQTQPNLPVYYPALQGCRAVSDFKVLNKIEEGTYGIVFRACERRTGEVIALKRLKMEREKDGFPITSLREVSCLLKAQHRNIVRVREIVVGDNMEQIFMVMDFVEHDLKTLMNNMSEPFQVGEVKTLMRQLLEAVAFLHENWIVHRDLKTSNLLLSNKGVLKVADFGLAREYGSPIKPYTSVVVTLWYRAPELILGCPTYAAPIDVWSCGCIFAELITREPLFPGKTEIDELMLIYKLLGTPNEKLWPGYSDLPLTKKVTFATFPVSNLRRKFCDTISELGIKFLTKFLVYDPSKRITAADAVEEALKSNYLGSGEKDGYFYESPLMVPEEMFPTWPAKSELTTAAATAAVIQRAAAAAAAAKHHHHADGGGKGKEKLIDGDPKKWVEKYGVKVSANAAKVADAGFKLKF